jgi:hypothetical protein
MILGGSRAGCVDEVLFEYTAHEGSLSTAPGRAPDTAARVLEKALSMDLSAREREEITIALAAERVRWESEMLHFELASGEHQARGRALRLALQRGHRFVPRLKMIAAAVAPGLAGRVLRRIDRLAAARVRRINLRHDVSHTSAPDADQSGLPIQETDSIPG